MRASRPLRLVTRQPVVGQRLPGGDRADVDVRIGLHIKPIVDRGQADARLFRVRPAAAEEVRPTARAERLRAALVGLVRSEELAACRDLDRFGAGAPVGRSDAARDPLARGAVAERGGGERLGDLELHAAAPAASPDRHVLRLSGGPGRDARVGPSARATFGGELDLSAPPAALERDLRVVLLLLVEGDLVVARLEAPVPLVVELLALFVGPALGDHGGTRVLGLHERDLAGHREVRRQSGVGDRRRQLADRRERFVARFLGFPLALALAATAACREREEEEKAEGEEAGRWSTHRDREPYIGHAPPSRIERSTNASRISSHAATGLPNSVGTGPSSVRRQTSARETGKRR